MSVGDIETTEPARPLTEPAPGVAVFLDGDRAEGAEDLTARLRRELEHHLPDGAESLTETCRYATLPGGKLLRPILLVEAALAVGGEEAWVRPAAAGTEYGHAGSLVHDDVIDGDEMRRGKPSVCHAFGRDQAILVGDALFFALFRCLAACVNTGVPAARVVAALDIVARTGIDLCAGQWREAELQNDTGTGVEQYVGMIRLKTAAFFRGACESGATLGGGDPDQVAALGDYGELLGVAFQMADDLLAFTSTDEVTGKPGTSDLDNHRMTLPLIMAGRLGGSEARRRIADFYGRPSSPGTRRGIIDLVVGTSALEASRELADDYVDRAIASLEPLPPSRSRTRLTELAGRAARRDR
jgi:geranylgeranyl pyrophosphate synthase